MPRSRNAFFSRNHAERYRYWTATLREACKIKKAMRFYTGAMFSAEYRDQIFIARHGSWNRTVKFGGDIAVAKRNKDGTVKSIEPLITGLLQNNNYVGRPVDVMNMPDGSLLISDDFNGAVYRPELRPEQEDRGPLGASLEKGPRASPALGIFDSKTEPKVRKLVVTMVLACLAAPRVYAQTVEARLSTCLACHGENGQSQNPDTPSLGAQQTL